MIHSKLKPFGICAIRLLLVIFMLLVFSFRTGHATTINIMLVYDSTATAWVNNNGGIEAFSHDAVNRMNQAIQNSGGELVFSLAHFVSVSYIHKDLGNDLAAITDGIGVFAGIHELRNQYGADLVALLVDTGSTFGAVGVAWLLTSWNGLSDYGFSANAIQSVAIGHTMTHEVGHNLGAHHSKYQSIDPGPNRFLDNQYSAGWYFNGYHTIMAYSNDGFGNSYQSAPLFSNPQIKWQGTVAGHADDGDNARIIRKTMNTVAGYRSLPPETGSLWVDINPAEARASGAKWRRVGTTVWRNHSEIESNIPLGRYTVEFLEINGWKRPNSQLVSINTGIGSVYINGSYTQSATTGLGQALDNNSLSWISGGDGQWYGQTDQHFYGGSSAQSSNISHGQETWLQTTVNGPGVLTFYWKVSSESDFDHLSFYIDGFLQEKISGEVEWHEKTYEVPSGFRSLRWSYSKDYSTSNGYDSGWIDRVIWSPVSKGSLTGVMMLLLDE